jgi:hypothetical protein
VWVSGEHPRFFIVMIKEGRMCGGKMFMGIWLNSGGNYKLS